MIVWSFLSADDLPTVYIPCRTNPHTFTLLQPHPHNNCHFILLTVNYVSGLVCVCVCVCVCVSVRVVNGREGASE